MRRGSVFTTDFTGKPGFGIPICLGLGQLMVLLFPGGDVFFGPNLEYNDHGESPENTERASVPTG